MIDQERNHQSTGHAISNSDAAAVAVAAGEKKKH